MNIEGGSLGRDVLYDTEAPADNELLPDALPPELIGLSVRGVKVYRQIEAAKQIAKKNNWNTIKVIGEDGEGRYIARHLLHVYAKNFRDPDGIVLIDFYTTPKESPPRERDAKERAANDDTLL